MANLAGEGLQGKIVLGKQVRPEAFFIFAAAYCAYVVIGFSASTTLFRTQNLCMSPYRFLTQTTGQAHHIIPYGETVWFASDDSGKETARWREGIHLGPAQSMLLPTLAANSAIHAREHYVQDVATGQLLIRGQLRLHSLYHQPSIKARLHRHAMDAPTDAVILQQNRIIDDISRNPPTGDDSIPEIPLINPTDQHPPSSEDLSPTPAPTPDPAIPQPTPTSLRSPLPRRSPRTIQFDPPDSDLSDTPDLDPDPPPPTPSPPTPPPDPIPTSRRRAQAPRPCFHRPPQPGDDLSIKWLYDDGTSTWLPARVCKSQRRKLPLKDIHGHLIPPSTTFVIEDLSTPHRPQYTKQLTEETYGDTWSYAPEPHALSLSNRIMQYNMPAPLYDLAARTAYASVCRQQHTLVVPFIERFRRQLQDAAFYAALLHLPVDLTDQGVTETEATNTFATAEQILDFPLLLTFSDSVPLNNTVVSPHAYAELRQAQTTSDLKDLGGTPDQLLYLLDHGHLDMHLTDANDSDADSDAVPAPIQAFLSSGIHDVRHQLLRSAKTTSHFKSLGGTQLELEYILRHDIMLLDVNAADWVPEVKMMTEQLDYSPSVKAHRVEEELQRQGYYVIHDDDGPEPPASASSHLAQDASSPPTVDASDPSQTFDPASLFEESTDPVFNELKSAFLSDFDPNTDLRSQLDDLDLEHLHTVHLTFEPYSKLKGDGRDVQPDDFAYDPESIVELKGYSPEEKRKHLDAIIKEFTGCAHQGVIRISLVPQGRRALPSKLVIKVKHDATGAYERHKARWVILGYLARYGLDFGSTYAPTSMLTTARLLFAVAAKHGLNVSHADIPQAFCQAPVDRPIWVALPKGISLKHDVIDEFRKRHPRGIVALRLLKSLYGLQSSPALFSKTVANFMTSLGFIRSRSDCTLYYKTRSDASGRLIWILVSVFVDDLLLTGSDSDGIQSLRAKLTETFGKHSPVTWNDTVSSFLGLHVSCNASHTQWRLSAAHKIRKLLETLNLAFHPKGVRAPWQSDFATLHANQDLPLTARQLKIRDKFRMICGSLIYISCTVRPDIVTIVNKACQGMTNPTRMHVVLLERCLAYLQCNPDLGLVYNQNGSPLRQEIIEPLAAKYEALSCIRDSPFLAFSDADFASMSDPRLRSTSGFAIYCFDCLIHWQSKRQTLTAKSTLEAELIAAATTADECSWLHSLASTLPFLFGNNSDDNAHAPPCPLLIDNTAALSISNHPKTTAQSKHLRLREFRIRDYAGENNQTQTVRCLWTPTKFNVADFFTKLLGSVDFPRLARFLVNAPFNPIADDASAHLGEHHLSRLPAPYHVTSRQPAILTDDSIVVPLFHLNMVTPIPYVPGVSYAQGGEEKSTLSLESTPAQVSESIDLTLPLS